MPGEYREGEPIDGPGLRAREEGLDAGGTTAPADDERVGETTRTTGDPRAAEYGEGPEIGVDGDFGGTQSAGRSSEGLTADRAEDPADSRETRRSGPELDRDA